MSEELADNIISVTKKIVTITCLWLLAQTVVDQSADQPVLSKADYLMKSKNQSSAAWILVGGGAATMPGSIPLFIASSGNKRKANSMSAFFKMENRPLLQRSSFTKAAYPVPAFKIKL